MALNTMTMKVRLHPDTANPEVGTMYDDIIISTTTLLNN